MFYFYLCYFILLLHYIPEVNLVLFTPLNLYDCFSYYLLNRLKLNIEKTQNT